MAVGWQQQEIDTFMTVLSLQRRQNHSLCSSQLRSELQQKCIKCAYMWSTQCCHISSVDSLVFLDFLSYFVSSTDVFQTQIKQIRLWVPLSFWWFRMYTSREDLRFPSTLIRPSSSRSAEMADDWLFSWNNSLRLSEVTGAFPNQMHQNTFTVGLRPCEGQSFVFQKCLPGLEQELGLGILGCRPCLLSSCLGSDASPVYPCEAQQTPPISPSRTETTGAFQQLDLMWFHHWWG